MNEFLANYLLPTESSRDDMLLRVAQAYGDNSEHATRLFEYMHNNWFMPATPVLSNGGTSRGLPISCFLNEAQDNIDHILDTLAQDSKLAVAGGGVATSFSNVRSLGESIKTGGQTSGVIPFIKVQDSYSTAVGQGGSLRRGSMASYLTVDHPEIREFVQMRRPTGGDLNRKALNIHHGVVITDEFMEAVVKDKDWNLISPKTKEVLEVVKARELWIEILIARLETGEPYIIYIDTVNRNKSEIYKKLNMDVKMSNLCSEIMLTTGIDYLNSERTAVCCLSSLNLEYYDDWKDNKEFIYDVFCFIDNVLQDFINRAPKSLTNAQYSAINERSVGIGVMGFGSLLQIKMYGFDSQETKELNIEIFKKIKKEADEASRKLADIKGACPDALEAGIHERFTHKLAIAPTASISIIAGNCSPGIEPYIANAYISKNISGSFVVANKFLIKLLKEKNVDVNKYIQDIIKHNGSVQHLNILSDHEKNVFKTGHEIDQQVLIDLASDRTPFICQSQSLNLFLPSDIEKKTLHDLHFNAWKQGIKSLYYCRSTSIQKAEYVPQQCSIDNKDCEACQ